MNSLEKKSSKGIYNEWKWSDILIDMESKVASPHYGRCVGDVGIKQEIHINKDNERIETGNYLVCEDSRGRKLYKKYIPQDILPHFKHLLEVCDIKGAYKSYKIEKYI